MILTAELEPQCHRHPGDVPSAVDGVAASHDNEGDDWIRLLLDEPADLLPPCLIDPIDHRQGEVLLALELVIERPPGVSGLARHPLQDEVAVAVALARWLAAGRSPQPIRCASSTMVPSGPRI